MKNKNFIKFCYNKIFAHIVKTLQLFALVFLLVNALSYTEIFATESRISNNNDRLYPSCPIPSRSDLTLQSEIKNPDNQKIIENKSKKEEISKINGYKCEEEYLNICFVRLKISNNYNPIFGFTEFIAALAILILIYNFTDTRYRFRLSIGYITILGWKCTLFKLTSFFIFAIGGVTLLTDIWFSNEWLIPYYLRNQSLWQGVFGTIFLYIIRTWITIAYLKPPVFSKINYSEYKKQLLEIILKGSDSDLSIIADELRRSVESLVEFAEPQVGINGVNVHTIASDILRMIDNKKLCRQIISQAPITAIGIFQFIIKRGKFNVVLGNFPKNISTEAITNKDSILYTENDWDNSNNIESFTSALYGNYKFVEALANKSASPLDIDIKILQSDDIYIAESYIRVVMITWHDYLRSGTFPHHSYSLYRALDNITKFWDELYTIKDIENYWSIPAFTRLKISLKFFQDIISLNSQIYDYERRKNMENQDFYNHIAKFMFKIISTASMVGLSADKSLTIYRNMIWDSFFGSINSSQAWDIIRYKLQRLIYNEIKEIEKCPNHLSAGLLGFCLYVMGLKLREKLYYKNINYYVFHRLLLCWTKNNYLSLYDNFPDVAKACLKGSIRFNKKESTLIKSYAKMPGGEIHTQYLQLIRK